MNIASFTLNYNKNARTNVDTTQVKYNWRGETSPLNSPGEQSLLHSRADNHNLNGTAKVDYTLRRAHTFTLSHTLNAFERANTFPTCEGRAEGRYQEAHYEANLRPFLCVNTLKASHEKALRLPTIEELFGDEDLEQGAIEIRPEMSHNGSLSFIYNGHTMGTPCRACPCTEK